MITAFTRGGNTNLGLQIQRCTKTSRDQKETSLLESQGRSNWTRGPRSSCGGFTASFPASALREGTVTSGVCSINHRNISPINLLFYAASIYWCFY